MVFDYTWNGITFEFEYVAQEDAETSHWTDVDFTDYSGCGDIFVDKKLVGNLDICHLTYDAQTEIRKQAYEYMLTLASTWDEERGDYDYHAQKEGY